MFQNTNQARSRDANDSAAMIRESLPASGSEQSSLGRVGWRMGIRGLAVRMAIENEGWGYTRILGELTKLGYQVSRSTVRSILKAQGNEPAPERLSQSEMV